MIRHVFSLIALSLLALLAVSCGSSTEFRITGVVEDLGTQNLRVYYCTNGAVRSSIAPAIDGKFNFVGQTSEPVLVQFSTNNGFVVGRVIVEGGDVVDARLNLGDLSRTELKGNKESEMLGRFISSNAEAIKNGDREKIDRAVEEFVRANPSRMVAGVVLTEFFDFNGKEQLAMELFETLEPQARPQALSEGVEMMLSRLVVPADSLRVGKFSLFGGKDSLETLSPAKNRLTVMLFTDALSRKADSVSDMAARVAARKGVKVIDVSVDNDTSAWKRSLRELPEGSPLGKGVKSYWVPGAIAMEEFIPLSIGEIPFFAVVDSLGRVVYRGRSLSEAERAAE